MSELLKLSPDCIDFSVVEIRFSAKEPIDVFFGLIYSNLKEKYPIKHRHNDNINPLHPKYSLLNENFGIHIGSELISFSSLKTYMGWDYIKKEIDDIFQNLEALNFFDKINRIGLRYTNFFENEMDIFSHLQLQLSFENLQMQPEQTALESVFLMENDIRCRIQIKDNIIKSNQNLIRKGAILDIDCSYNEKIDYDRETLLLYIDKCHRIEKEVFRKILKKEFLEKYNPEYKD